MRSSQDSAITYPIDTDESITTWASIKGSYFAYAEDYMDSEIIPIARENTGVNLEINTVSDTIASEQFQLMIASGTWPDFCQFNMYSGGLTQAYTDDVVMELDEAMLQENAPDYWALVQSLSEDNQKATVVEGRRLALYNIKDEYLVEDGLIYRQDWLDECGLDVPATLEEFNNVLYTFQDTYNTERTLDFANNGSFEFLDDCFGTKCLGYNTSVMGAAATIPIYINDGQVTCSWAEPGYRDYVEWVAQIYADGLISIDFYTENPGPTGKYPHLTANETGVWNDPPGKLCDWEDYVTEETGADFKPVYALNPTDGDGIYNWMAEPALVGDSFAVTATCQNPELVLNYFNYYYTSDGCMLANFGGEGWTFEYDEQGQPYLTDILVHNEFNMNIGAAMGIYTMTNLVPHYALERRRFSAMDPSEVDAYDLCNDRSVLSADHYFPAAATLTTAENDRLVNPTSDMCTISQEILLGMMIGQRPITDDTWQEFVDTMYANGLQEALDLYQSVYDGYLAGER